MKITLLLLVYFIGGFVFANQTTNNTNNLIGLHLEISELKESNKKLKGDLEAINKKLDNLKSEFKHLSNLITYQNSKKETKKIAVKKTVNAKKTYEKAKEELGKAQFKKAIKLFKLHLSNYPKSKNKNSIYYYLGKSYYYDAQYKSSIKYYELFEEKAKKDKRIPKAMYAQAKSYLKIYYKTKAKEILKKLIKNYPKSPYAKKAKKELKTIKK
jgi:TolA-binding protein